MKSICRFILLGFSSLISLCFVLSCQQAGRRTEIDESAFVFETSHVDGDEKEYSRSAVITGHVSHHEVYQNTKEISITIPFFDRVSNKQRSTIYEDRFAFSLVPYAPRTISMPPYIDHLVICPGDSIHVELDFADLGKVYYSGKGAENNEKFNVFHVAYYLKGDWPGFSRYETDSEGNDIRAYEHAGAFAKAAKEKLESHLARLDEFVLERRPSPELISLCRKEIEADYYSALIQGLLMYKSVQGEEVSGFFKTEEAEPLFDKDCLNSNLFELASNISMWELRSLDQKEVRRLAGDYPSLVRTLKQATKNDMLFQMMVSHFYNQLLEANDVDRFEESFDIFNENVTFPLLKLSIRDRYVLKKAYQQNPRSLSDAILNADKPRDGQTVAVKENEGVKLLRSMIEQEERKVVFICIGATWCPGVRQEFPYLLSLAEKFQGRPLRIVNFFIDNGPDDINTVAQGIENFHLTDAQRAGLDPILHLGRGIPFYILIDKQGVIVDFGEHLRPSIPETTKRIEEYLGQ